MDNASRMSCSLINCISHRGAVGFGLTVIAASLDLVFVIDFAEGAKDAVTEIAVGVTLDDASYEVFEFVIVADLGGTFDEVFVRVGAFERGCVR